MKDEGRRMKERRSRKKVRKESEERTVKEDG
jgi:hypothetical protein